MAHSWLWLAVVGGCGRVGFDAAAADGDIAADAFVIPTGPFGPAQPIMGVNDPAADDDPTLTGDMLELVFDSERDTTTGDLYSSTRPDLTSPWSTPVIIAELSEAGFDEDGPCLDSDGLAITFSTNAFGGLGGGDLFRSTRPDRASPWSPPVPITELSTSADDERFCRSDGLLGFVHTDPTGNNDLYMTTRANIGDLWLAPAPLAFNTSSDDQDAAPDPSGRVLVFASQIGGNFNLYVTTRATRDDAFGTPVPIAELNTNALESDPWLSPDLHTIVFVRGMGTAVRDLYFATR